MWSWSVVVTPIDPQRDSNPVSRLRLVFPGLDRWIAVFVTENQPRTLYMFSHYFHELPFKASALSLKDSSLFVATLYCANFWPLEGILVLCCLIDDHHLKATALRHRQTQKCAINLRHSIMESLPRGASTVTCSFPPPFQFLVPHYCCHDSCWTMWSITIKRPELLEEEEWFTCVSSTLLIIVGRFVFVS